jgi:hypothetical protein
MWRRSGGWSLGALGRLGMEGNGDWSREGAVLSGGRWVRWQWGLRDVGRVLGPNDIVRLVRLLRSGSMPWSAAESATGLLPSRVDFRMGRGMSNR